MDTDRAASQAAEREQLSPAIFNRADHLDDDECGCERLDNGECGCLRDRLARGERPV